MQKLIAYSTGQGNNQPVTSTNTTTITITNTTTTTTSTTTMTFIKIIVIILMGKKTHFPARTLLRDLLPKCWHPTNSLDTWALYFLNLL